MTTQRFSNIQLTATPTEAVAAAVTHVLQLDGTGIAEKVSPTTLWDALVLTGEVDAAIAAAVAAYKLTRAGVIEMVAGALPAGALDCNGATVSQATYAALFAVTGHSFGADPGGGNFILPDLRDKFPVGIGSTYALGATGGAATHTLTEAQLPAHTHTVADTLASTNTFTADGGGGTAFVPGTSGATGSTGSGEAHNNLPPYLGVRYVIRTGL